jgi:hypothetical protein
MNPSSEIELSPREIGILAALVYESVPRIWMGREWCCPHCLELNEASAERCACGVDRETGPQIHRATDMLEELVAPLELLIAASDFAIGGSIAQQ